MSTNFFWKTLPFFTLLTLVTACGGSSGTPSPTPAPTAAPTIQPTATPEPTPTAAPAPTTEPTPTPEPVTGAPNGGSLIIDSSAANASFWAGDNDGAVGSMEVVNVDHPNFTQANRISVTNPDGEFWNGQLSFPSKQTVATGDVVLLHLYMRSIANTNESGHAFTTVFLEENSNYDKYINREITAAADWVEYYIPAEVGDAQASGDLSVKFGFGAGDRAQTFEIGGVELLNYGAEFDIALLPITRPSYEGREANAEWRSAAAARIEEHRKGDFTITVLDSTGAPTSGASVNVEFEQHAYHFGSVTVGHILMNDSDPDAQIYREKVLELFNQSGPENDLKWAPWAGEWGSNFAQNQTLQGLQWLRDNGLYTRGHVMVWPSKRNLPQLMQEYLPDDYALADPAAKQVVLDHIDDIASKTANYLDEWDVINEPYDNHYLMDAFGNSVMLDWFNQARTNLPSHGLFINDYSILSAGGRNYAHQQHYQDTIRYLVDNNAPITGIGLQSHFSGTPTSISTLYTVIERFHTAFPTLAIRSTEFDVDTSDEELQADYTRDFLTLFFSHPATVGVQAWGFWAGAHWRKSAAMYTLDWQEKPNGSAWKNQIYSEWWNDFEGTTDDLGNFSERGFYGRYKIMVSHDGLSKEATFHLTANGVNELTISFAE